MNRIALAIGLALAMLSAPSLAGSSPSPLIPLGAYGGELSDPVVVGDWTYVPTGTTLTAWKLSQPGAPIRHGDTRKDPVGGVITGLVGRGNYLYASWQGYQSDRSGVSVYSIADRANPVLVSTNDAYVDSDFRSLRAIALANDRLYLFDGESGIHVGSLVDPENPSYSLALATSSAWGSATVIGNRVYTQGRSWLGMTVADVYDVSVPDAPVQIGGGSFDGFNNFNMQFAGSLAVGFGLSVTTYETSALPAMTELGTVESEPAYLGILLGSFGYGVGLDGLDSWNLSNPAAPTSAGHFAIDTFAADAAKVSGEEILLLTRADRFTRINATNPALPTAAGGAPLLGGVEAKDIALISGGQALVVQSNYGLSTVDAGSLEPLARYEVDIPQSLQERSFEQIAVNGNRAYLTSWGSGLYALDISNPLAITELSRIDMPFATAVAAQGNFVYTGTSTNGGILSVIDVSNPASPVVRGVLETSKIVKIAVRGNYLFLADEEAFDVAGMRIVDISNPDVPVVAGHYLGCGSVYDVALNAGGNLAYAACDDGLHIVDVSNPSTPQQTGFLASNSYSYRSLDISGDRAFLTSGEPVGVIEIDISNPASPVLVHEHVTASNANRIRALSDGRVFVFSGQGGIQVFGGDRIFAHGFD